ncbi:MAG TPA: AmmeMemoRadiSam system protein B, partial [Planctomycetota bacterium]|nr:AmmeMemoRadiSam system protein B [Planctomycetota bacterium]
AFACLSAARGELRRVILIGPSHHVRFDGVAVSRALAFETPLGPVPVDLDRVEKLLGSGRAIALEVAHVSEHALEVELPFLIETLGSFSIVPLVTGRAPAGEVADVLELAGAGEPDTLVVVSSDLSHYHSDDVAKAMDRETARSIEHLRPLTTDRACGHVAINGLIELARRRALSLRAIDVRTSADTVGDPTRVVGYGAFAAFPRED